MNNRFFDLAWNRQADGAIRLTQTDCGDSYIVDAHPEQIMFIARQICGMKPNDASKVAELERRIAVLTDKLQDIVCNGAFRSDLIERLGDGFEYLAKLDGLLDIALEFDGGRLTPEYKDEEQLEGHGASRQAYPCTAIDQAKKTHSSPIPAACEQLGLEV